MKKLLFFVFTIFFVSQSIADEPLKWFSFNEGLNKAKAEHKILLVDFYTDWCGWCKKMDAATYSDNEVIKLLNDNFVVAKLNPEEQGSVSFNKQTFSQGAFAQAVQVTGFPTTGFFKNDSVFIGKVSGYFEPKQFIELLHRVLKAKEPAKK